MQDATTSARWSRPRAGGSAPCRRCRSGLLQLHEDAPAVLRVQENHRFPVRSYLGLFTQAPDLLLLQIRHGRVDVVHLERGEGRRTRWRPQRHGAPAAGDAAGAPQGPAPRLLRPQGAALKL